MIATVSHLLGKCGQCKVIRFSLPNQAPVDKYICAAVGMGWAQSVERRQGARQ